MEFVYDIDKNEYEEFVKQHKKSHFLQGYSWGEFCKESKGLTPYYVGVKENKNLIASALLLEKKLPLGYSYFYCPRGYIIDFTDFNTLDFFNSNIKMFLSKRKGIFLKFDPDIIWCQKNPNDEIIPTEYDQEQIFKNIKKIGFKHLGFNKRFEHNQPRYTFRLKLNSSLEQIKNNFHSTTKKIINKGNIYNLNIYKNDSKYIKDFYTTMIETAKREDITQYSMEYYKNFYEILHKENNSDIYLVEVNIINLKKQLEKKVSTLQTEIQSLTSESKKQEVINQISKIQKTLSELCEIKDEKLPLASIITAKYGNKVWTIHGGNHCKLRGLNANYLIYYEIIKDAINEGYEIIDFFGTVDNPTKDDPEYGIHLFKKRLNGDYIEFIGEFDLVIKPILYFAFTKLVPIYRKIILKLTRKKQIKD